MEVHDGMGRYVITWDRSDVIEGVSLRGWPAGTYHFQDPTTGLRSLLILQP
jgi:hypothetical protein